MAGSPWEPQTPWAPRPELPVPSELAACPPLGTLGPAPQLHKTQEWGWGVEPALPRLGPHRPWPAPSVSLSATGTEVSRSGVVVCVGHGHHRPGGSATARASYWRVQCLVCKSRNDGWGSQRPSQPEAGLGRRELSSHFSLALSSWMGQGVGWSSPWVSGPCSLGGMRTGPGFERLGHHPAPSLLSPLTAKRRPQAQGFSPGPEGARGWAA